MAQDVSFGGSVMGGGSLRAGNVTIDGLDEVLASLEKIPITLQNKALRKAMRAAAKPVLARAKANAPVGEYPVEIQSLRDRTGMLGRALGATDKQVRKAQQRVVNAAVRDLKKQKQHYPGTLRDSIKIRAMKRNRNGRIGVTVQTAKGDFRGDTFYGAFQEYGTSKIPAKGYMRKAFDAEADNAINVAAGVLRTEINNVSLWDRLFSK